MCGDHQLITQCQLVVEKIVGQRVKGHGSILIGHEIPHLSPWLQKHLSQNHARSSYPHHVCNEKGGSP
jgi:hypothetical protein